MFVSQPTHDNPSAMWSNYTDGANYNCQRLIWDIGYEGSPTRLDLTPPPHQHACNTHSPPARARSFPSRFTPRRSETARYLVGCDAYDCCKESQSSNQVEFQIPNVYYANPDKKAEVNWRGLENVTVFSESIEADGWEWNFTLPGTGMTEYFRAYTQDCEDCVNGVRLVLWQVFVFEDVVPSVSIQFKNYRGIPDEEAAAFKNTFYIPEVCQANNLPSCNVDDYGADTPAAKSLIKQKYREIFGGSTCTGTGEFCCGAPGGDVDNCPKSAQTDDCSAKNDCCCG